MIFKLSSVVKTTIATVLITCAITACKDKKKDADVTPTPTDPVVELPDVTGTYLTACVSTPSFAGASYTRSSMILGVSVNIPASTSDGYVFSNLYYSDSLCSTYKYYVAQTGTFALSEGTGTPADSFAVTFTPEPLNGNEVGTAAPAQATTLNTDCSETFSTAGGGRFQVFNRAISCVSSPMGLHTAATPHYNVVVVDQNGDFDLGTFADSNPGETTAGAVSTTVPNHFTKQP